MHTVAKAAISRQIVAAGMHQAREVLTGQLSGLIFYGNTERVAVALNNVCFMPWVRHIPGMADVGDFWVITPQGVSKDPVVSQYAPPFHA